MKEKWISSLIGFLFLGLVIFSSCREKKEKFPIYFQEKPGECGAVCLQMIFDYYGKHFNRDYLVKITQTDYQNGVSMLGLSEAAESLGFRTMGVRITYDQLKGEVLIPCILHWHGNHFVVLYKIEGSPRGDILYIADPALGLIEYNKEDLCKNWFEQKQTENKKTGLALLLEPTEKFKSIREK
jgi:ATP-binding cassette subfamily B protein